jgi:hypothetical protein
MKEDIKGEEKGRGEEEKEGNKKTNLSTVI